MTAVRIVRGRLDAEEIAALTAALMLASRDRPVRERPAAGWDRGRSHRPAHSWQSRSRRGGIRS